MLPGLLSRVDSLTLQRIAKSGASHLKRLAPSDTGSFRSTSPHPLTSTQQQALDIIVHGLETGGGVFLHGGPGRGKSKIIHHLRQILGNRILVTATTGKAAFLVGGETIHGMLMLHVKGR
jgi:MoxR-like ATPase